MPSSACGSAETLQGSAVGTPAYMSPEQACGELDRLGRRSDVYSLGATLYCLLTGRPPLERDDIGEVLRKVQRGEFAPPRKLDPTIDPALEAVCRKAMAVEPEDRYATSRMMADDIERWAADEPVFAWREPLVRPGKAVGAAQPHGGQCRGGFGPGGGGRACGRGRGADHGQRCAYRRQQATRILQPSRGKGQRRAEFGRRARGQEQRRLEVRQRTRATAVRPRHGGDQTVPRRGQRGPASEGEKVRKAAPSSCTGRPTSTASWKGCSRTKETTRRAWHLPGRMPSWAT